ncbi:MAG: methionine synthase [Fermentimonas caenicola]|jgi:5-methyltetrahydrofolate--homocysteine methyltransferase|uniref:methionine synthase n=1 Tax=Lascolabacillus sp. TaxID=1924068 RepID=UPI001B3F6F8E|nr:methionine synthase [Lascolabacillus sp.]MBP6176483.1 methionine synthase [Fermentimonas sp.]MBP7103704.1 methionine synthase [Fermentimonas sp.]MDD4757353.1 methionine synthase [Lascolabacillus sp.]
MKLENLLSDRILILDGAMGTMIQRYNLTEEDFRGDRFRDFDVLLKGNNDLLSITRPDVISEIHREYLAAGADIIETNTFNSTSISMQDYKMSHLAGEINRAAVKLAREAADEFTKLTPEKPRFVAGSIGPTNKTASMSPRVEEPMYRAATFDHFKSAYKEQIFALVEGGADLLLIETIFDTLNAKAAIFAAEEVAAETGINTPIMLSVTLSDKAGRTLSGQTLGAFVASVSHANPLLIGLNCSLGAAELKPYVKELGKAAPFYISTYPNAGLPNQLGEYDETPEKMASQIREFIDERLINVVGGCCGTTPEHISKYVDLVKGAIPHERSKPSEYMQLSGLEMLEVSPQINFLNIGERCNVAGSRKFLRLIKEQKYEEALDIARKQVEDGAQVLDINMDEGLLDGVKEMTNFLNMLASDPDVSRVPIMIDSSDWNVLEAGLKCVQGKPILNSISLKNGEVEFLRQAKLAQMYGAAVVVMAFDETGQAASYERRIEICERAYRLLTENGFDPKDIIFDPNILAIATGMDEHKNYAVDFIESVTWIKENLPHAKVSGGVSNLSFSFRGNDYIRELMHSAFLYHAINAGLDMGIVNPSQSVIYEDIPENEKQLVEDVIFNRNDDATERLMAYAEKIKKDKSTDTEQAKSEEWRNYTLDERLSYALVKGISDHMEEDLAEALRIYPRAVDIIDKPLMEGMNRVGDLFGAGKMFLPQVVKAARAMKKAVSILQPVLEAEKSTEESNKAGKILLATVKGDVHDIGKNIVSIVLSCNNYDIIDLGVMVPPEKIIETIKKEKPDIVGLSGLITPSLGEMGVVAEEMQKAGLNIPLLIGGATTSKLHTALKIEPKYSGPVVYVKDASQAPSAVANLMNRESRQEYIEKVKEEYERLRENYSQKEVELVTIDEARENAYKIDWNSFESYKPNSLGRIKLDKINIAEIIPWLDWKFLFPAWNLSARFHTITRIGKSDEERAKWIESFREDDREKGKEAIKLYDDAVEMLNKFVSDDVDYIRAVFGIYEAYSDNDTIYVKGDAKGDYTAFPFLRQQKKSRKNEYYCLSDFTAPLESGKKDYIGAFAVTAGFGADDQLERYSVEGDEYNGLLMKSLLDRLAEAATEWLHAKVRREYWGYASDEDLTIDEMLAVRFQGIRPAVGYPSIPDQTTNFTLHDLLSTEEIGIKLTENGVMHPNASVSGLFFSHPQSKYFGIGEIDEAQMVDYANRKKKNPDEIRKFLMANLV